MEIIIYSENNIINITNKVIDKIIIKSYFKYQPTKLQLSLLIDKNFKFFEGDNICIKTKENNIFYGYIFTKKIINNQTINIIAYNSLRYLVTRDTYIYKNKTASQVIKMICADFKLKIGNIEETEYNIPYRIEENQTIFDIIYTALNLTKNFNNKNYIFFDDFGKICLKSYNNMKLPILIDTNKYTINYYHTTSIDKNVYNSIKVSLKNKKTKIISTYLEEDSINKIKWGTLRKFERLPNDFNTIQAKNYAKNLLTIHNKINEKIEIVCFGNETLKAGNIISLLIDKQLKNTLVEECTHIISNNEHIMKLTLTII